MSYLRQIIALGIIVTLPASLAVVAAERGLQVAAICGYALLPSCIVAFGWLIQDDLFNPLGGIWLSLFLGMGFRAVYIATSQSERADALMWQLKFEDLAVGAGIAILAAIAITVGYFAAARIALPVRSFVLVKLDRTRLFWVSILLIAVALVAAADLLRRTGFDPSGALSAKRRVAGNGDNVQSFAALGYHTWIACTIPCACFYIWYWEFLRSRNRLAQIMAVAFFAFVSAFAFLTSARSIICILLLNSLYIAHTFERLRLKQIIFAGASAVFVLTVMLTLRKIGQEEHKGTRSTNTSDGFTFAAAADAVAGNENFADLGRLTRIYRGVPELMKYKFGMSYVLWVVAPVPRTYWDDKPAMSQGLEITDRIFGGRRSATGIEGGGRPPGFIAEVIMNFGLIGVPFCGLIYGGLLRMFQNFYLSNPRSHVLLGVFILLPLSLELVGGEFSRIVVAILQGVIPLICLLALTGTILRAR